MFRQVVKRCTIRMRVDCALFRLMGREGRRMTLTLSGVLYAVAVVLFILAAIPPTEPYRGRLSSIGLAFFAGGHLVV